MISRITTNTERAKLLAIMAAILEAGDRANGSETLHTPPHHFTGRAVQLLLSAECAANTSATEADIVPGFHRPLTPQENAERRAAVAAGEIDA